MKTFRADLHIHTCLSPCADLDMSPKAVVETSLEKGLDLIAVCDHNSAENIQAAVNVGVENKVHVLSGMEITTAEEVHVLGLFDDVISILKLQTIVYDHLPPDNNVEELFGEQIIANEWDEIDGYNRKLLIGATSLSLQEVVDCIHSLEGLAIASHVDRDSFSILGQLGIIPEGLELDALEISARGDKNELISKFPDLQHYTWVRSSDAHSLDQVGNTTTSFMLLEPSIQEIRFAFQRMKGRHILLENGT